MTWAPEDVTDAMADRCIENHTEAQLDCPYCQTRLDLRVCAQCDEDIWPHETCPNTHDEPALVEICTEIPLDMEADVKKWDGQLVTGKQIAEMHGALAATIAALANVLKAVLES